MNLRVGDKVRVLPGRRPHGGEVGTVYCICDNRRGAIVRLVDFFGPAQQSYGFGELERV